MLAGGQEKFAVGSSIYRPTAFLWLLNTVMKLNLFCSLILALHLSISVQGFFQMKNSFLLEATLDKEGPCPMQGMELGDFFKMNREVFKHKELTVSDSYR